MRSECIALSAKIAQIDFFSEPDTHLFAAGPVTNDLLWQIVAKAGDENGNDLWLSVKYHFSDSRLGR